MMEETYGVPSGLCGHCRHASTCRVVETAAALVEEFDEQDELLELAVTTCERFEPRPV